MFCGLVSRSLRPSSSRRTLAAARLLERSSSSAAATGNTTSTSSATAPPSSDTPHVDPLSTMDFFGVHRQGCQMVKFDPFLIFDCARLEGQGHNSRKGRDQILQHGVPRSNGPSSPKGQIPTILKFEYSHLATISTGSSPCQTCSRRASTSGTAPPTSTPG